MSESNMMVYLVKLTTNQVIGDVKMKLREESKQKDIGGFFRKQLFYILINTF